ncbi:MAG: hypothetical protein AMXMBFR83_15050 [Phycisphaerae bacterium]
MNDSTLARRQAWYRLFPEGSIEFLLVTRIILVTALLALAAFQRVQRHVVLAGLFGVLWVDYVLVTWWLVQMAGDVQTLGAGGEAVDQARPAPWRSALVACLPATAVLLLAAPWPSLVIRDPATRARITGVLLPVLAILYVASVPFAQRALGRLAIGPGLWRWLLLVPIVHWFALHRLLAKLNERLRLMRPAGGQTDAEGPSPALPLADAAWALALIPWSLVVVEALRDAPISRFLGPCGAILAAVFLIADVAVLESTQRRFLVVLGARPREVRGQDGSGRV